MLVGFFYYGHALFIFIIVPPPAGERWYGVPKGEVQRVLKFDTAFGPSAVRVVVGGCAANINKTFTSGLRPWENMPTALRAGKTIQPRLTVSRLKGRPFYGQAKGQLRLTCTFSAECAQREEMHPFCRLRRRLSTGKRLTRFSVAQGLPTNRVRLPPRRGRFAQRFPVVSYGIIAQHQRG